MIRYKFYFKNLEKPIIVEAPNKQVAKTKLHEVCSIQRYAEAGYLVGNIVDETSEVLVAGVSEKLIQEIKHLWDGTKWIRQ